MGQMETVDEAIRQAECVYLYGAGITLPMASAKLCANAMVYLSSHIS